MAMPLLFLCVLCAVSWWLASLIVLSGWERKKTEKESVYERDGEMEVGAHTVCLCRSWLLYLEPGFLGPGMLLEEGETVLSHQPGQQQASQGTEDKPTTITIGSIRRLVKVGIFITMTLQCHAPLVISLQHFYWETMVPLFTPPSSLRSQSIINCIN